MRKHKFPDIMLASSLSLLMVLGGCGHAANDASPASETPADPVTLRISAVYTLEHPFGPAIEQIISNFEQEHPEVTVQREFSYDTHLQVDLAADNLPEIFTIYGIAADNDYVKKNKILDLTPELDADSVWKDSFIAGALDNYKLGTDKYYAAPLGAFSIGFYYNKEMFQNAGVEPPKTWNELLTVIAKLRHAGYTPWAMAGESWRTEHLFTNIFYKLNGIQKSKDVASRAIPYSSPEILDTFRKMIQLVDSGAFKKNDIADKYQQEIADFNNEKAAMRLSGSWTVGETTGKGVPEAIKSKVGFFPFPYFEGKEENRDTWMGGTSDAFVISSKVSGHQKEMAIALVKALTSSDSSRLISETAHDLTAIKADIDPVKTGTLLPEVSKAMSTGKAFAGDFFGHEPIRAVNTKFYEVTLSVFSKQMTAEEACKQMDEAIAKNK